MRNIEYIKSLFIANKNIYIRIATSSMHDRIDSSIQINICEFDMV